MKNIKLAFTIFAMVLTQFSWAFGPTGHRTVGKIAESYLSKKAKKEIAKILDGESLAMVSTYADDIKSDDNFDYTHVWHYVNVEDSTSYANSEKNPKGDLIAAINECVSILENDQSTKEEKAFRLKMLIHFIGDLHQPLHCGRQEDLGGNKITVKWFGKKSNLHRVWDSEMINSSKLSYTELSSNAKKEPYFDVDAVEKGNVITWYNESKELSYTVYNSAEIGDNLYYEYNYEYFPVVKNQLNKAGIRLAKVLNEIFG